MKPFLAKTRKMSRTITTFPQIAGPTRRYADNVVEFYEGTIKNLQYTTGTRADVWSRDYWARQRDRHRDAVAVWVEHAKQLELSLPVPDLLGNTTKATLSMGGGFHQTMLSW